MNIDTDVAVIGSGFSAVALSLNLLDLLPPTAKVSLVGHRQSQGQGIAYSTEDACHLLNVPAGRMGLFADRPDHFARWLAENGHDWGADDFVPRGLYGRYVGDCLEAARKRTANRAILSLVDTEALGAEAAADGGHIFRLGDGRSLSSRVSVLCTGAGTSRFPLPEGAAAAEVQPHLVADPWDDAWRERLPGDADVLFVGSGLTMVDQCLSLAERGFSGTMHAVSRRGLLPQAHLPRRADPAAPALSPGEGELSEMLARLKAAARSAEDWRAVMDGLRPVTQSLWKAMDAGQRERFLRHAAPFWNVHRHRMAPSVAARVDALRRSGRLRLHRGRLASLRAVDGGLEVHFAGRAASRLAVALAVNCTGLERCSVGASLLLADLAAKGLVEADPHGLGIAVDENSAVVSPRGRPGGDLYAMGPLTAGRHWEITAVPDIRVQARSVAECINGHFTAA